MNVLLLTIATKKSQKMNRDIANEFVKDGHNVYIVCPEDDENQKCDTFQHIDGIWYLFVINRNMVGRIGIIRKTINLLSIDSIYKKAIINANLKSGIDLILFSTPPITLANTIKWAKKRFGANTYLMLKDIFPQNAVDMGMMRKTGIMGLVYKYFRLKEKKLYQISDYIGCMSTANCRYMHEHNPNISEEKVGICVNSYAEEPLISINRSEIRKLYQIPENKVVFLYGGNLGKPQGLQFFADVLKENAQKEDRYFLICGGGNDQKTIINYIEKEHPANVQYMPAIPAEEFDKLSRACDVGLVFLDYRFTIPNFPSRMLSIMLNQMPILAATDTNTDVGEVIADGDMGWWCESREPSEFSKLLDYICENPDQVITKGENARKYYEENYTSRVAYHQILSGLELVKNNAE